MRSAILCLTLAAVPAAAQAPTPSPAPSPDTRTIRDVVTSVAKFQLKPLQEGEYRRGTWEEVQANKLPTGLTWTYQYGVVLYGLLRASEAAGDKTYADFVADHNRKASAYASYLRWVDATYGTSQKEGVTALLEASRFRRFIRMDRLDFCGAMAHSMLESVLKHGVVPNESETEILDYVADYIQNKQGRIAGEGVFFRPEAKNTLWIDDLYMSCPFLIRRAAQKNQPALLDDAARQVKGMAKRQQEADGLWLHAAWVDENRRSLYKWGRANGWAMVTTVEVLSAMPDDHPDRQALIDILKKHVAGVKKLQKPSGLWPQVLDHPELWDETSCSAMFAYSIARGVRRGWLPKEDLEVARKAFAGVMRNVTPDGQVLEVSEGTGIGETLEFYRDRKRPVNDHHGPGPVMFAGAELMEIDAEAGKEGAGGEEVIANVTVYCASSRQADERYRDVARRLGAHLASNGVGIVYGGGAVGSMGALADGALSAGGPVIGVLPEFMKSLEWGHAGVSEMRVVESMHARKHLMLELADAAVALPGGCGTLEEVLEAITWKRLGLYAGPIAIVNQGGFYDPLLALLDRCVDERFMDERHRSMWLAVDEPEDVLPALRAAAPWDSDPRRFAVP